MKALALLNLRLALSSDADFRILLAWCLEYARNSECDIKSQPSILPGYYYRSAIPLCMPSLGLPVIRVKMDEKC